MSSPRILAVVVRYKTPIQDCQTLTGLSVALQDPNLANEIGVLLWDNSPEPLQSPQLPIPFEYRWTESNVGIAGAYNQVFPVAEARGIQWMLLLDHDTDVTADFLRGMIRHSHAQMDQEDIGCVVPFVRSHGNIVSPRRFRPLNRNTAVERSFSGTLQEDGYAVNSGSLMRVAALRAIGGYSNDFWLDLSDVYAFQQLYRHGLRLYVARDLEINHDVGGLNFEQSMVPERYETFLVSESAYLQIYRSRFENLFHTAWLGIRAARQYLQYRDKRFAKITFRYLLMRLTMGRERRMRLWMDYLRLRRSIPTITRQAQT
jgi:GT2 family glycosyltransferase